jgi:hypothetical protein
LWAKARGSSSLLGRTRQPFLAVLGKHAIVPLDSTSAISSELPIGSVYFMHRGVLAQLQKVGELPKKQNADRSSATQTSFYLTPVQMMKSVARLLVNF